MTERQAHYELLVLLEIYDHHSRWLEEENAFYKANKGFHRVYRDFGTYEARLRNDIEKARKAIAESVDEVPPF